MDGIRNCFIFEILTKKERVKMIAIFVPYPTAIVNTGIAHYMDHIMGNH